MGLNFDSYPYFTCVLRRTVMLMFDFGLKKIFFIGKKSTISSLTGIGPAFFNLGPSAYH